MTKQTIEVYVPNGYEISKIEYFSDSQYIKVRIKEKIQPRRIVLEFTNEKRKLRERDYFIDDRGFLGQWRNLGSSGDEYTILREVKETDLSLNSDEPKLSLSVDECKYILGKFQPAVTLNIYDRLREFIKDK